MRSTISLSLLTGTFAGTLVMLQLNLSANLQQTIIYPEQRKLEEGGGWIKYPQLLSTHCSYNNFQFEKRSKKWT